jgi:hypothetical protein
LSRAEGSPSLVQSQVWTVRDGRIRCRIMIQKIFPSMQTSFNIGAVHHPAYAHTSPVIEPARGRAEY